MTKSQHAKMYAAIEQHGKNLLKIFPNATIKDPVKLCKALRRLEIKAHAAAVHYCNGDGQKDWPAIGELLVEKTVKILGEAAPGNEDMGIIFNGDARGYALKISAVEHDMCGLPDTAECKAICKDWGGFGIIAPDFFPVE